MLVLGRSCCLRNHSVIHVQFTRYDARCGRSAGTVVAPATCRVSSLPLGSRLIHPCVESPLPWLSIVSPGPLLDGWFYYYSAESIAAGEGFINPFNTQLGDDAQTFAELDADDFVVNLGEPELITVQPPTGVDYSAWAFDHRD